MTQYDLESQWITTEGIAGVNYRFSDLVLIKSGEYTGQTAEVISLISINPEPTYLVVQGPEEKSAVCLQSELEPMGLSAGGTLTLHPPGEFPSTPRK